MVKTVSELEVEALPQDLPREFQINLERLKNFGDHILIKDIAVSEKVKIQASPEDVIALVQEPRKEEVVEEAAPSVEGVEVIKKEAKEGEEAKVSEAPQEKK